LFLMAESRVPDQVARMQMSSGDVRKSQLRQLHEATMTLREALVVWLGELVPPYADEVLHDLQDVTAEPGPDLEKIRVLVTEASGVMEMLPSVPPEWEPVNRAAVAAGLDPAR
jgi:hypothetical protein